MSISARPPLDLGKTLTRNQTTSWSGLMWQTSHPLESTAALFSPACMHVCRPFIRYCMKRVHLLRKYDITPVLVFDGGYLPTKANVEQERRE